MAFPTIDSTILWTLANGGFKKTPHFNTKKQIPAARRGIYTIAVMPYCTWDFSVNLENITGNEATASSVYALFTGLYMQTCGGAGFWYMNDVNDNTVTTSTGIMLNVTAGASSPMSQTGDGSSKQFQLARTVSNGIDITQNVSGVSIYVNGSLNTGNTISSTGVVTFTTAPANNATLAWSGNFLFLCLFDQDTLEDLALMAFNAGGNELHSVTGIKFGSVFQ